MSKKNGYSISYKDNGMIAVGVSRLDTARWRIEHLEQNQADAGPSALLAKEMIKYSDSLAMVAPGGEVRTSLISLPKLKKKELGLAVSGWVAREESTTADYWNVSWSERTRDQVQENADTKDIFLLYATGDDVGSQIAQAKVWGCEPSRLLPDFMILESMYRRYGMQDDSLKGWNVVFVGKEDHFLCVSTPSGLLMTRPLPADLSEGEDTQEYLNRLATEVDRSIFFARQTEFSPNIEKIVVCGDTELAQSLVEQLKEETTVQAEFWDIAGMFEWEGGTLESRFMLPVMAAVVARRQSTHNLMPAKPRVLLGPQAKRWLALTGSTAAAALVPVFVVGGLLTATVQNGYLKSARKQLVQAQILADDAAKVYQAQRVLLSRENHISDYGESDLDYARVLLHLAALTPEEIIYKDLRLKESRDGNLVIYLAGESKSPTVEAAQLAFLKFKQSLDGSHLLVGLGEAKKLNISVEQNDGQEVKKVEFSMEYQVQETALAVALNEERSANGQ